MRIVKVLAIDGGGIRGIIPAEIEKNTGKPIAHIFDLIGGTSTGGILTLGLTKANTNGLPTYSAEEGVELYERFGSEVFKRSLWHRAKSLGNIVNSKYPGNGLQQVMERFLGDSLLSQALSEVLVTSYDITNQTPYYFKSTKARENSAEDFKIADVARATSAAPTYFPPVKIPLAGSTNYKSLIDGGVFANNPALTTYVEARKIFPQAQEFMVLSLGTGELTGKKFFKQDRQWGLWQWAQSLFPVMMDGQSDSVNYHMSKLLPDLEGKKYHFRFQVKLERGTESIDNTSAENIARLKLITKKAIAENRDYLEHLGELVCS